MNIDTKIATERKQKFPIGASVCIKDLEKNPYPVFEKLRQYEPISWIAELGVWYVVNQNDLHFFLHDAKDYIVGTEHSTLFDTFGEHMLTVEGERHLTYKKAARKAFAPKQIRSTLENKIKSMTDALIDSFIDTGSTEVRQHFASRLPVQTTLALFGLPLSEEKNLRVWYNSFEEALANFTWNQTIRERAKENVGQFHELLNTYIEMARLSPNDSLLSQMVANMSPDGLQDEAIKRNASIIFFGGISTVEALILNSLYALFTHPETLDKVKADLDLIPQTLEEVVRWQSPVQSAARHVIRKISYKNIEFIKGDSIFCMLGAANRDPSIYSEPSKFDINRNTKFKNVGFAVGPHHCLGANLARVEARIAIKQLFTRLPDLKPDNGGLLPPEGYEFRQPKAMNLIWNQLGI